MNINILNETVILIDTDFLNERIEYNLNLYSKLYPDKSFVQIDLSFLLCYILLEAKIKGIFNKIDVIFSYTLANSRLEYCTPSDLTFDITSDGILIENDLGEFTVSAFFADENETCSENFVNILRMVYYNPMVSKIILVADSPELNDELNFMEFSNEKSLFILKNYPDSHIDVPIQYAKIDIPIANELGLSEDEILFNEEE